ncbi:MAG: lipoyl(octanoyl) transferase LipB [Bacteroidetes bacterium]|nr:lipoyl(octanoyl) transferase LipB [Bacteroidota bacterium]
MITFKYLGLIDYKNAWDYQEKLFNELINIKKTNRDLPLHKQEELINYLLFCEHPPVFTLGKSGSENNLLINKKTLEKEKISYYKINRGGDITFHGPGQIVGYPILDLENFSLNIREYIYKLEEVIILTLNEYNIKAERLKGATGVWLDSDENNETRKICSIGVRISRWITMHGFAFNVNTNLKYYDLINPCGFTDKAVTSMEKELGEKQNIQEVKNKLRKYFEKLF